jgi:HrpA-like RNA helicase
VQRGSSVVVVDARDEAQAEQAVECLHQLGAVERRRAGAAVARLGLEPAAGAAEPAVARHAA